MWDEEISGTKQFILCRKLKELKHPLKRLNAKAFSHIFSRTERARLQLESIQSRLHNSPQDLTLRHEEEKAKTKTIFLAKAEKSFYYQKAKCLYIRDGDRSTKLFHSMCKRNAKRNFVAVLNRSDGSRTTSVTEVLEEFVTFYRDLVGSRTASNELDESVFNYGPCLGKDERKQLDRDVTADEIRAALFSIPDDKALRPDGYSSMFFKKSWPTIANGGGIGILHLWRTP